MKFTEKFELQETIRQLEQEIRRQNERIRILEADNEDLKARASIMCAKTYRLLKGLKLSDTYIFTYYKGVKWNS